MKSTNLVGRAHEVRYIFFPAHSKTICKNIVSLNQKIHGPCSVDLYNEFQAKYAAVKMWKLLVASTSFCMQEHREYFKWHIIYENGLTIYTRSSSIDCIIKCWCWEHPECFFVTSPSASAESSRCRSKRRGRNGRASSSMLSALLINHKG